ncbi:MAG TPA: 2-succinyl-5-enolpyruvyl-6-hydroxy-3-cyclohexene-1-carboxylate synthase, partial [Maribacter sp.]|nr:2-succinyl-5-enolpyruvyl-6-hydroxy-3-cyclohexene-1-carboxylate synthase [Maribacter sp.]
MKYSAIPTAQTIVQHCLAKEIGNIVISPGSRNAPLTIAFAENPFFKCFSIVDERSAAFFALGMAQQLKEPVVVLCTSGSALLNYYPAIAEAYYSNIPLIVISADRPVYKLGIGDGQTIDQRNVFKNHIGYSANLKQDVSHASSTVLQFRPDWLEEGTMEDIQHDVQTFNDQQLNLAFDISLNSNSPVHINAPFEEPLYNTVLEPTVSPQLNVDANEIVDVPNLELHREI